MPTVEQIVLEKWKCDVCNREYDTSEKAEACEQDHINTSFEDRFSVLFPKRSPRDSKWAGFCVGCGEQFYKYTKSWDGHRSDPDQQVMIYKGKIREIFGGDYCEPCYEAKRQEVFTIMDGSWRNGSLQFGYSFSEQDVKDALQYILEKYKLGTLISPSTDQLVLGHGDSIEKVIKEMYGEKVAYATMYHLNTKKL